MNVPPRYQTFGKRFLAGIVDSIVFIPLMVADLLILQEGRPIPLLAGWAIISFMSYSVYSVVMHALYGQTLGKMATKVKVLAASETSVPGFKRALLRESVYIMTMIASVVWFIVILLQDGFTAAYLESNVNLAIGLFSIGWVFLELVTMLMNPRRRALHDYIGGTVVVNPPFIRDSEQDVTPNT
ncbi:MAG TPA: RDD family protein [Luteolibacter sp.]|nr:RDD family protein [Luteolibacter sp.]